MRIFHIMLFGVLMQNGKFAVPPAHQVSISQPRPATATTGSQLRNAAAYRKLQRVASRQLVGTDLRDDPLECLRTETENARSLELGARLSIELFKEQIPEPRTKAAAALLVVMSNYHQNYNDLLRLYGMSYRFAKIGLAQPKELSLTIETSWGSVKKLDVLFPTARGEKYIGGLCKLTAQL